MIEHIPELVQAGVDSFKIEGRMKTALYVAVVARTYSQALSDYMESEELYKSRIPYYKEEIAKVYLQTVYHRLFLWQTNS